MKFIDGEANVIDWIPNPMISRITWEQASMVHAVQKWIFGRPTAWPVRSLRIPALLKSFTAARTLLSVVIMQVAIATMACVTRMDATSILIAWALRTSTAGETNTLSTHSSP